MRTGGRGGGILFFAGQTINFTGILLSNGGPLAYWFRAGGGAGGSILVEGNNDELEQCLSGHREGAWLQAVSRPYRRLLPK